MLKCIPFYQELNLFEYNFVDKQIIIIKNQLDELFDKK